jgi:hypothetical protein
LTLDSSYSHYLTKVDPRFNGSSIHRLQFGGLKFQTRSRIEVFLTGGVDATRFERAHRGAASVEAGLSKAYGASVISLVYRRGFSTAVGAQGTLNGHVVSASLSQWLSRRMNVQLNSSYTRGASLNRAAKLDYLSGTAEVQIALQNHVMFSVQSSYVSQRGVNLSAQTPVLSRYSVAAGFQFFFSSLGGRQRGY